ncbi:MAG: peptide/nickel transport system permease protein, partial [Paracoccaceae bacterium]
MTAPSDIPDTRPSFLTGMMRICTSSPVATIASVVLALLVLAAIFAPWIVPHDPTRLVPSMRLKPPSETYLLGTDAYGRDLLSRIVYGARVSLIIGVGAAVAATLIGLAVGLAAGYFRRVDAVLMRVVDGLM